MNIYIQVATVYGLFFLICLTGLIVASRLIENERRK